MNKTIKALEAIEVLEDVMKKLIKKGDDNTFLILSNLSSLLEEDLGVLLKSDLYDKLYSKMNKIKICNFKNGKCEAVRNGRNICCGPEIEGEKGQECEYLTAKGCSIKCLFCKIWFCDYIIKKADKEMIAEIERIRDIAYKYDLVDFRKDKEYTMDKNT